MSAIVASFRPIDDLADALIDSFCDVTRADYRFLTLLHEFDLRQGWREWGCTDCAHWLNFKCGLSRTTAVEKLRVAYALTDLPQIEEAFEQGHLSYSKVRALTRAARVADETALSCAPSSKPPRDYPMSRAARCLPKRRMHWCR